MFRFISSVRKKDLRRKYLSIYEPKTHLSKEKELQKIYNEYQGLKDCLPSKTRTFKAILTADFKNLSHLYFSFEAYLQTISEDEATECKAKLAQIFNYNSRSSFIKNFLSDPDNGFTIKNCVYCEMEDVAGYFDTQRNVQHQEFETEHILDKGKCPFVSLSLFNFAPSCSKCNAPEHKGQKTLGQNVDELQLTSPTSLLNKFDEEVFFTLDLHDPDVRDLIMFDGADYLKIHFKGKTEKYHSTIEILRLVDRYNSPSKKKQILEPLKKRLQTTDDSIAKFAQIEGVPFETMFLNYFGIDRNTRGTDPLAKCRFELFNEIPNP